MRRLLCSLSISIYVYIYIFKKSYPLNRSTLPCRGNVLNIKCRQDPSNLICRGSSYESSFIFEKSREFIVTFGFRYMMSARNDQLGIRNGNIAKINDICSNQMIRATYNWEAFVDRMNRQCSGSRKGVGRFPRLNERPPRKVASICLVVSPDDCQTPRAGQGLQLAALKHNK